MFTLLTTAKECGLVHETGVGQFFFFFFICQASQRNTVEKNRISFDSFICFSFSLALSLFFRNLVSWKYYYASFWPFAFNLSIPDVIKVNFLFSTPNQRYVVQYSWRTWHMIACLDKSWFNFSSYFVTHYTFSLWMVRRISLGRLKC